MSTRTRLADQVIDLAPELDPNGPILGPMLDAAAGLIDQMYEETQKSCNSLKEARDLAEEARGRGQVLKFDYFKQGEIDPEQRSVVPYTVGAGDVYGPCRERNWERRCFLFSRMANVRIA